MILVGDLRAYLNSGLSAYPLWSNEVVSRLRLHQNCPWSTSESRLLGPTPRALTGISGKESDEWPFYQVPRWLWCCGLGPHLKTNRCVETWWEMTQSKDRGHKIFKNTEETLGWWDLNLILMIWYFSGSTTLFLELKGKAWICHLKCSTVLMELH